MAEQKRIAPHTFLVVLSVVAVFAVWVTIRAWLIANLSMGVQTIHVLDIIVVFVTGFLATVLITRVMAPTLVAIVGPTQANALKLSFQLLALLAILVVMLGFVGTGFVNALVSLGFFGIVLGLASQAVLSNLFSGIMLLASRPFNISDRISLIAWQYGKFAPSLPHGWLEPSYTGTVKEITLTYTKILTDSNALLRVPNAIVTQSVILNLSNGRSGHLSVQFEVPIQIDPERLHNQINTELAKIEEFKAEEENFEILEIAPTSYLVFLGYRSDKHNEREMKVLLLQAVRRTLIAQLKERT